MYHGSDQTVRSPKIIVSKRAMDFGGGFYTTESRRQAEAWARTARSKRGSRHAFVSEFEYMPDPSLRVLRFDEPDETWLDFVMGNRSGSADHGYDIVIGPVADDSVYETLFRYQRGRYTKEETIDRLKARRLDGQVLFHTDKSLGCILFVRSWEVKRRTKRSSNACCRS